MMERKNILYFPKMSSLQTYTVRVLKMVFMGLLLFSLSSCVAQQADLVRFQQEFEAKIAKLDQEKKALEATLGQANQAIQESQAVLAQQKSEVAELVKARARFNSELRSLREENLPQLSGELETESHRLQGLERKVDDLKQKVKNLKEDVTVRDQARATQVTKLGENVEKEFAQQRKTMSEHMSGFRASLVEFKDALGGIDTRLAKESTRAMAAETNMRNDVEAQQAALQVKLDSDTNTLKQYLENDVKASISSVANTLQKVNASFGAKLDEQRSDFNSQSTLLSELNTKVGTELASLKQQDAGTQHNLENLTKAMTQLRSGLEKVGTKIGSQVDGQAKTIEQTGGRLKQLEGQYTALSKKLDADTKALRGYLDKDIRSSLQSMAKAVEAEKTRTSQSSNTLEGLIQQLERTTKADLKNMQAQVTAQDTHVKDLNQSVVSMREVLDSMAGMLGKRSDDQMRQIGKLSAQLDQIKEFQSSGSTQMGANVDVLSSHLNEVTTSVQSVVTTLGQVKTSLTARLDAQATRLSEQEQRLTETVKSSVSPQQVNQGLQANVEHLNQLTAAMGQLKGVVSNIGTTLGQKIDEHEGQLAGLAQRMQQLQSSPGPTSSTP